jgi:DNA-binding NarL/FixJ family response regulator
MKVFIADDSNSVIERLTDLLEEIPGTQLVGCAGNVSEAVRGVAKTNPDALILDLQMPGGSGLDVLRAVRAEHPYLQVVICTNHPHEKYREECLNAGANFFLDKSSEFEKILSILRQLVRNGVSHSRAAR